MADEYGMTPEGVAKLHKSKSKIAAALKSGISPKQKKTSTNLRFPEIDKSALKFLNLARNKRIPVRPVFLMNVATFIASTLNIDSFKASWGWHAKFCRRHNINFKTLHGKIIHLI